MYMYICTCTCIYNVCIHMHTSMMCPCSSVSISLDSGEPCDIQLLVSYVVSCAAWNSSYDVRVFTKDKTMKVIIE